ncbi:tubulin delta chain isoform X2 [Brienomyrus brachyistius]|uniref:tubulin delta chain isoform X2 n=1 Tax=Brienomyrus brachyistius TaxID=42636 RepID=UPI0020B1A3E0|nr:tubulin delta chain isoform X2 [Brienomyrus brachyistius]
MSLVTLNLGQCGNQVGQELLNVVSNDAFNAQKNCPGVQGKTYYACALDRFFREEQTGELAARAVLIDMEPKVINHAIATAAKSDMWKYGDGSYFCEKQGSGNNWAKGFCVHGPQHEEAVVELVRREVERCDRLAGILTMMSVAGGTGSGMGTYITQCLRDMYPHSFILNHLTWPYSTGELSDGMLVHENDSVHKICAQLMNIKHISFSDINKIIAHQLGSVLQPADVRGSQSDYSGNPVGDLMSSLACHAEYKLLSLSAIPHMSSSSLAYSSFTWPGLLKHLRQMLIANARMEEGIDWQVCVPPVRQGAERTGEIKQLQFNTSLANLLILRGKDVSCADSGAFLHPGLYSSWLPPEAAFRTWSSLMPFNGYEKSATLISNSQSLLQPLNKMVGKAWNMFASRAYIHQYTKYGISEEDFLDSFTALEQVISSYTCL